MEDKEIVEVINLAKEARLKAYAPYSKYKVGCALLAKGGLFYFGANIENAPYRATHAEKLALDKAVFAGEREFLSLLIVTDGKLVFPCAYCLQDLTEFDLDGKGSLEIITANLEGKFRKKTLAELLPERFGPASLGIDTRGY